jgi:DNA polymerase-2
MSDELSGWLLDVYADTSQGVILWLLGDDGQRHQLRQPLTTTFYAAGPFPRLRKLWTFLRSQNILVHLSRTQREDLFDGRIDVMAIEADTAVQPQLFRRIQKCFPDLDYYDTDIPVSVQYAARFDCFPTLRCQVTVEGDSVLDVVPLASRWQIDNSPPPLRVLTITPDVDPSHRFPRHLRVGGAGKVVTYPLQNGRLLLIGLQAKIKRHDPDLILTQFGDTWLFPYLRQQAQKTGISFNPSRDGQRPYRLKKASSYFTYGMVLHRGEQTYLYGRYHIDIKNALLFNEYDVSGVLEQAQVTGMPVQEMARRSPGAGITATQMITALRRDVLVPYTKQQAEYYKSARTLLRADRGGLVFQPQIGLHTDVVEIDFVSMYPSIISLLNISPETVKVNSPHIAIVPELKMPIDQSKRGLLPETLQPILEKRIAIKTRLASLTRWDCRRPALQSRSIALKWLLVVAFGYAGYKRARFGRIEAHEAITAYSREALLRAKETAESLGYEVVHMYVDGLWVKRKGIKTKTAVQPLLDAIESNTGLPIALEGFYKWIAFLPSKSDERVPVPNRYFGAFETGELKVRGIEMRRHDTPPFVADLQRQILEQLAQTPDLNDCLSLIRDMVRAQLEALRSGQIDPQMLLASQTLSRSIAEYKVLSSAARAVKQLQDVNKLRFPGQRIRFVFTVGHPGVYAWDLPQPPDMSRVDIERYVDLTLSAVTVALQPWGVKREWVDEWVLHDWYQTYFYLAPGGKHGRSQPARFTGRLPTVVQPEPDPQDDSVVSISLTHSASHSIDTQSTHVLALKDRQERFRTVIGIDYHDVVVAKQTGKVTVQTVSYDQIRKRCGLNQSNGMGEKQPRCLVHSSKKTSILLVASPCEQVKKNCNLNCK